MSDTVQQIKDKLSIVDVVAQYVKLERAGQGMRARCPFHAEKTPSFHVSPDRGTYHCFGCNVGGDIFSFVQAIEGLDFKGALKVLAEKAGVPLEYERSAPGEKDARARLFELLEAATIYYSARLSDEARAYLSERGLEEATIQSFRLGLANEEWSAAADYLKGKKFTDIEIIEAGLAKKNDRGSLVDKFRNRIIFPIADSAGRIIGFSGRSFGSHASPEAPKYLNSPETPLFHKSRVLYGFDRAKMPMRKYSAAILVEGQMDLIMSHQAGWPNAVAGSGTAFTGDHAALIKRQTENLILALDQDQAGIKAAGRAARIALQAGFNVKVAQLPAGLDPADFIKSEGPEAWRRVIRESKDIITFLLDVLAERMPERGKFRRAVESAVLPFLADIASPIAKEQYAREIAERLGVSLEAVLNATHFSDRDTRNEAPQHVEAPAPVRLSRERQVVGILLWQQTKGKPDIDAALERRAREVLGESSALLDSVSGAERESLIFSAEALYSEGRVAAEIELLILSLRRDSLREELARATEALRSAEERADEAEVARLMESCKLLTGQIAETASSV